MAHIIPFRAHRPPRDKAPLVSTRSYISYSDESLEYKLKSNPFTYLHVINPDNAIHAEVTDYEARFRMVREAFEGFHSLGYLNRDKEPGIYIYRQVKGEYSYTGVVAGVHVNDYLSGHVKKHEHTITSRETMFKNYLKGTGVNAEPVLLAHPNHSEIQAIMDEVTASRSDYEFASVDGAIHYLWPVFDKEIIEKVQEAFLEVPDLYIADGHHRSASSALLAKEMTDQLGEGPHSYFMSLLISEDNIHIYDFNRLVKDIGDHTNGSFLKAVRDNFEVTELTGDSPLPSSPHAFSMYFEKTWYCLKSKPGTVNESHPVERLDCQILSDNLLEPVLGIEDLKTDKRVAFLSGPEGSEGLEQAVDSGKYQVAFALFPVTFEQLKLVSDEGMIMPPKSTYVEPKLRSGLTIYDLFDD